MIDHQNTPIRLLSNMEPVRDALKKISLMVSFRRSPSPDEIDIMRNFIKNRLGNSTPKEMIEAFEAYCSGEFPEMKFSHEVLTVRILGQVIYGYRSRKVKINHHESLSEVKERKISDGERARIREEFIEACIRQPYEDWKKTGNLKMVSASLGYVYRFMKENGMLKLTPDLEKKLKVKTKAEFARKIPTTREEFKSLKQASYETSTTDQDFYKACILEAFSQRLEFERKMKNQ